MKYLLLFVLLFSFNTWAQQDDPRRDAGGWKYNGVFKFSDKLRLDQGSDWNFTALDVLLSVGPRYHRYDPIRKSDGRAISSFTKDSLYTNLGLEYRFYKYLSLKANWVWESQDVERYDGDVVTQSTPYARESHLGLQFNYDPFFMAYEVGQWRLPHFYLNATDQYVRRYVDMDVAVLKVGFRRKISETLSLSFSGDYTQGKEFVEPVFGKSKSHTVGVNVLLLHKSGFGIRLREEEGVIDSDAYKYKTKAFGIMPFVSLL